MSRSVSAVVGKAPGKRLRLSRWLAVESVDDSHAVVFHTVTGARRRLSRPLYDLLTLFRRPGSLDEMLGRVPDERHYAVVEWLLDAGLLVDTDGAERPPEAKILVPADQTLFRCPRRAGERRRADVAVFGVPSDGPGPGIPGTREAPAVLRRRSCDFEYRIDIDSGRPMGWFDVEAENRILAGVVFEDWGNVSVHPGESQSDLFSRIETAIASAGDVGALPVVLGGDHSVTLPVVRRLQASRDLVVVQLDAHSDFDPRVPEPLVDHRCVARRLWQLPRVERIVQIGHRGFTLRDKEGVAPERVDMLTVPCLRREGERSLLDRVPADAAVYLTIDVCCLDPAVAPGTARPSPGGLRLDEAKRILRLLGSERRVIGLDIVELNPMRDQGDLTALAACHLLLAGLGAVFAPR